jgi:hypothetical protein
VFSPEQIIYLEQTILSEQILLPIKLSDQFVKNLAQLDNKLTPNDSPSFLNLLDNKILLFNDNPLNIVDQILVQEEIKPDSNNFSPIDHIDSFEKMKVVIFDKTHQVK